VLKCPASRRRLDICALIYRLAVRVPFAASMTCLAALRTVSSALMDLENADFNAALATSIPAGVFFTRLSKSVRAVRMYFLISEIILTLLNQHLACSFIGEFPIQEHFRMLLAIRKDTGS
jgi:hypothetical protein